MFNQIATFCTPIVQLTKQLTTDAGSHFQISSKTKLELTTVQCKLVGFATAPSNFAVKSQKLRTHKQIRTSNKLKLKRLANSPPMNLPLSIHSFGHNNLTDWKMYICCLTTNQSASFILSQNLNMIFSCDRSYFIAQRRSILKPENVTTDTTKKGRMRQPTLENSVIPSKKTRMSKMLDNLLYLYFHIHNNMPLLLLFSFCSSAEN